MREHFSFLCACHTVCPPTLRSFPQVSQWEFISQGAPIPFHNLHSKSYAPCDSFCSFSQSGGQLPPTEFSTNRTVLYSTCSSFLSLTCSPLFFPGFILLPSSLLPLLNHVVFPSISPCISYICSLLLCISAPFLPWLFSSFSPQTHVYHW